MKHHNFIDAREAEPRIPTFSQRVRFCPSRSIVLLLVLACSSVVFAGEIHEAVKENDSAKVKRLIKDQPDLVFSKDEDGFTPLHLAAANGSKELSEFLVENRSEVNARDNNGSTPLHQAVTAEGQHNDVAEMLLAHKAVVNTSDKSGLTPLHYATLANNANAVKLLLSHGADANAKDSVEGNTPLIIAAGKGFKEVAEALLARGADVNVADKMGTPLTWALHTGHTKMADLLRQHGGHE